MCRQLTDSGSERGTPLRREKASSKSGGNSGIAQQGGHASCTGGARTTLGGSVHVVAPHSFRAAGRWNCVRNPGASEGQVKSSEDSVSYCTLSL